MAKAALDGPAKREGVQVMAAEMQVASWHGLIEALQANASTLPESAVTVLGGQDALLDHLAGFIERYCDFPFDAKRGRRSCYRICGARRCRPPRTPERGLRRSY